MTDTNTTETPHPLLTDESPFLRDDYDSLRVSDTSQFGDEDWVFLRERPFTLRFSNHGPWDHVIKQLVYTHLPQTGLSLQDYSLATIRLKKNQWGRLFRALADTFKITPNELHTITLNQVLTLLEGVKQTGARSAPYHIAQAIQGWLHASAQDVLSPAYRAAIPPTAFTDMMDNITKQRENDMQSWKPIEIDRLPVLWGEAKLWVTQLSGDILGMARIVGHTSERNSQAVLVSSQRGKALAAFRPTTIDGLPWYTPRVVMHKKGRGYYSETYQIYDMVCAHPTRLRTYAIFIILLLTGMRRREVANLKLGCCQQSNADDDAYTLRFTRFKTEKISDVGAEVTVSVPNIVYTATQALEGLADWYGHKTYLLESPISDEDADNEEVAKKNTAMTNDGIPLAVGTISDRLRQHLNIHPHQCRKTIAWLLVSQDEENIELIRELLGHASYKMTLEYLSRNPEMVEGVKELFQQHYAKELTGMVEEVMTKPYSGVGAARVAENIERQGFSADMVSMFIEEYIKTLLDAGLPIFFKRIPIGGYCLAQANLSGTTTPCTKGLDASKLSTPVVSNCKFESCPNAIITESSLDNIEKNIAFYKKIIASTNFKNDAVKKEYLRKLEKNKEHLNNLLGNKPTDAQDAKK